MAEQDYRALIQKFLSGTTSARLFTDQFFDLWKTDRDVLGFEQYDPRFVLLLSRLFSSCDAYDPEPAHSFEISEEELKNEVGLLSWIWWG